MNIPVAKNVAAYSGGVPNRFELLVWLNETLQTDFTEVEHTCTGAAFCQLMDWCFPRLLDLSEVRFDCHLDEYSVRNFDILQDAFRKAGVTRYIPIKTLVERNTLAALTFLHWFRQFFEINRPDRQYDPVQARNGQRILPAGPVGGGLSRPPPVLISDEDDVVEVVEVPAVQETKKMDTTVIKDEPSEEAPVSENPGTTLSSCDMLPCFIKKYCSGSNNSAENPILSPTHPADDIEACNRMPYCLYLYMGVQLEEGLTTSVVLVGFFHQGTEVNVVRPLLTLQMSSDVAVKRDPEAAVKTETGNTDARLLLSALRNIGLPFNNLVMFYCNTANQRLRQALESELQAANSLCVSLCGLTGVAERACHAALSASFPKAVDLVKAIHQYYDTNPSSSQSLRHLFAEGESYNPASYTSAKCLSFIQSVLGMVANWRALVDYFKSETGKDNADWIRDQLMEHKVKLHFLFLSCALEPLRALQALQHQGTTHVSVELQLASVLFHTYASSLLQPSDLMKFLATRNLRLVRDGKRHLPSSKLDIGSKARDFLWATAVVDLSEDQRMEFLNKAAVFFVAALVSLNDSIPDQLGCEVLRNINVIMSNPKDPKQTQLRQQVLKEVGLTLGLFPRGSRDHLRQLKDLIGCMKMADEQQTNAEGHGQTLIKALRFMQQNKTPDSSPIMDRLVLTLLALPASLQMEKVFSQVSSFKIMNEAPRALPGPSISTERPRLRRKRPGHVSRVNADKGGGSSSSEDERRTEPKPFLDFPIKRTSSMEESDNTDNSSDVVEVTEVSRICPSNRLTPTELVRDVMDVKEDSTKCPTKKLSEGKGQMTPVAETVYVISEDEDMVAGNSNDPSDVGELVWCVVDGFSTWPVIIESSKQTLNPGKRMVWWYGQSMSTQVSVKDLKPFAAFAEHFCSNSFAVFVTYREAIFVSLQEAALRCKKQFPAGLTDKEEQLKQMLDWAFGGFLPTGPDGFKPTGATKGALKKMNRRPKVKKKLFLKADTSDRSGSSSSMSTSEQRATAKPLLKPEESKTAGEEDLDSPGQVLKRDVKEKKARGGLSAGRGGWRGGKVQQKRISPFNELDNDRSADYVPYKKRTLSKFYIRVDQTSVYKQPDQRLREEIIRKIMTENLNIEGYCLCCATQDVEISHPLFKGSLCSKCKDNLTETLYRYDEDGYQSYCTICCYGLEVILCGNNSCSRSYCTDCLNILVGPGTFNALKEKDPWICYLCQPHEPHGALIPREDWSIRVQELFANNSAMEFEPHRVYPSIPASLRRPIRVLSLFDGIATGYVVLKDLGFKVEQYVASEVCEDSLAVAENNHGGRIVHVGDARHITEKHLKQWGPFDLLIGGSPCNDLSIVNPNRKGLYEGTGRLFFEYYRILQLLKPEEDDPRPFFWLFENVVFMNTHDKVNICRFLECNPVLVDAVNVSPAHRARCFWGNIPGMSRPITASQNDKLTLQDCLEIGREARVEKVRTITTNRNSLKQGKDVSLLPVLHHGREDNLWITELEKIFGFPKHYTDVRDMNRQQRQKLLGKAWSVPVIRHLFAPLKDYFACEELPPLATSVNSNCSPSSSSPASPELHQLR